MKHSPTSQGVHVRAILGTDYRSTISQSGCNAVRSRFPSSPPCRAWTLFLVRGARRSSVDVNDRSPGVMSSCSLPSPMCVFTDLGVVGTVLQARRTEEVGRPGY